MLISVTDIPLAKIALSCFILKHNLFCISYDAYAGSRSDAIYKQMFETMKLAGEKMIWNEIIVIKHVPFIS